MENTSQVMKWSVIIGIVIVLNLFFNYALAVVYKAPDFNKICEAAIDAQPIVNEQKCVNVGGKWTSDVTLEDKNFACDATFGCSRTFQEANDIYNRNVFVTLVVLGVITLFVSFLFKGNLVLAYGLSIGSILSFLIASTRYWGSANDIIKLLILGVALGALIYLALKKFSYERKI